VIAARSFSSIKGDADDIQENSPAQTTEAARSFAKHANNSSAGKNQMGKGTLALENKGSWRTRGQVLIRCTLIRCTANMFLARSIPRVIIDMTFLFREF
jgi:hypothetical protein